MLNRKTQLLSELFKYRQRESRAPLEDFLTASLVGFARTLSRENQFRFAADMFVTTSECERFGALFKKTAQFRWDTQFVIQNGKRPDIVFWIDDVPAIVVENKLWSAFQTHEVFLPNTEENSANAQAEMTKREISQLQTYGQWLRAASFSAVLRC